MKKTSRIYFRIDEVLLNEFKTICNEFDTTISEEIREMIKVYIKKNKKVVKGE